MSIAAEEWLKAQIIEYFKDTMALPWRPRWYKHANPTNAANYFIHHTEGYTHKELEALATKVINEAKTLALIEG